MFKYKISSEAKSMFAELCPKANRRCSVNSDVHFKIIRSFDLGRKIVIPNNNSNYIVSNYYDLLLFLNIKNNTIEEISKDERYYFHVISDVKEDYKNKYNEKNKCKIINFFNKFLGV
ncbi:hypothetical protein [Paenibacillus tianjinensis]|uniref:Uncharacterized protein n=1 Tax=Paenibacillus tianjinensis TaxID=2810347 RepID=A0ABX7L7R4_9BACL|nr:hypothetical protein [Paenibacillus tianjinensis]QSF43291.1 hypothetical protein JRJ22_18665 [Paenibacillus tianjinensis]